MATELALASHARQLRNVRVQSVHEVPYVELYEKTIEGSLEAWSFLDPSGKPLVLFGVIAPDFLSNHGYLWAIVSDDVTTFPYSVARESRKVVSRLKEQFPVLYTTADAKYALADKWIKWLGFKEIPSEFPDVKQYRMGDQ